MQASQKAPKTPGRTQRSLLTDNMAGRNIASLSASIAPRAWALVFQAQGALDRRSGLALAAQMSARP